MLGQSSSSSPRKKWVGGRRVRAWFEGWRSRHGGAGDHDAMMSPEECRLVELENESEQLKVLVAEQQRVVQSLRQQQELRDRQKEQQLRTKCLEFFQKHDPVAATKERLNDIMAWAADAGSGGGNKEKAINVMLMEQYGCNLDDVVDHNAPAKEVQIDLMRRRLDGFYRAMLMKQVPGTDDLPNDVERRELAIWTLTHGEDALNHKLAAKYGGNNLSTHLNQVRTEFEPRLRNYYINIIKRPELLARLDDMLIWVANEGAEAMQELLFQRYGKDLDDDDVPPRASTVDKRTSARAVLVRDSIRRSSITQLPVLSTDPVATRRNSLVSSLSAFLEVHDKERLEKGGVQTLSRWSMARSDDQLDKILMQTYGTDLKSENLRSTNISPEEATAFGTLPEGPAYEAAKRAHVAIEERLEKLEKELDEPLIPSSAVTISPFLLATICVVIIAILVMFMFGK